MARIPNKGQKNSEAIAYDKKVFGVGGENILCT
jgi:hypothetical protein